MNKFVVSVLCTTVFGLGALNYSAQACDCDKGCEAKCEAGQTEECHCKECSECKKGKSCGSACKHHKKSKTEKPAAKKTQD